MRTKPVPLKLFPFPVIKHNATQQESGVEKSSSGHAALHSLFERSDRESPPEVAASSLDAAGLKAHPVTPSEQNHR